MGKAEKKQGGNAEDAIEMDSGVSPQDPKYLESLEEPFQSIAAAVLPTDVDPLPPVATRHHDLEVKLRQHLFDMVEKVLADENELTNLGKAWRSSSDLCFHIVHCSEADGEKDPRYEGMNVRKLPFVLLEDLLDSLSVKQAQELWAMAVEPAFDSLLFAPLLWEPSDGTHPCWLPFIKLANKFLRRLDGQWAARVMLTLSKVFPLGEKSATRAWGSYHADATATDPFETFDEFEAQQQNVTTLAPTNEDDDEGAVADYSTYESVWSLQRDLCNPSQISVADFLKRVQGLLNALESHTVIQVAAAKEDAGTDSSAIVESTASDPYLTSSRLLSIQLSDPDFRVHTLTQLLIGAHHLASQVPVLGTKLVPIQVRAKDLMRRTPPHGTKHLELLESLLQGSEERWRTWKKNKCQPSLDEPLSDAVDARPKRKRLDDGPLGGDDGGGDDEEIQGYQLMDIQTELPEVSQKMRKVAPSVDQHFEEYVDALDPEAGIEAEYHPKNNGIFCWRALRLMSVDHLDEFSRVRPNGDMEPAVRHIWKEYKSVDIPGECPEDIVEEESEDEKEVSSPPTKDEAQEVEDSKPEAKAVTESSDAKDVTMQDAEEDAAALEVSKKEEDDDGEVQDSGDAPVAENGVGAEAPKKEDSADVANGHAPSKLREYTSSPPPSKPEEKKDAAVEQKVAPKGASAPDASKPQRAGDRGGGRRRSNKQVADDRGGRNDGPRGGQGQRPDGPHDRRPEPMDRRGEPMDRRGPHHERDGPFPGDRRGPPPPNRGGPGGDRPDRGPDGPRGRDEHRGGGPGGGRRWEGRGEDRRGEREERRGDQRRSGGGGGGGGRRHRR